MFRGSTVVTVPLDDRLGAALSLLKELQISKSGPARSIIAPMTAVLGTVFTPATYQISMRELHVRLPHSDPGSFPNRNPSPGPSQ
jgi:hypothetical protein